MIPRRLVTKEAMGKEALTGELKLYKLLNLVNTLANFVFSIWLIQLDLDLKRMERSTSFPRFVCSM